ncbi:MAG: hypothetical protein KDD69_05685 [Bdellovibrionales bacterium]|nr:hypothetical protein [Bdellovibrionales bacterium]
MGYIIYLICVAVIAVLLIAVFATQVPGKQTQSAGKASREGQDAAVNAEQAEQLSARQR